MIIVSESISLSELKKMAQERFGILVKAVIDVEKEIMAVDDELHATKKLCSWRKALNRKISWVSIFILKCQRASGSNSTL